MKTRERIKQLTLKLRAATWNIYALADELMNILETAERNEELDRLNGKTTQDGLSRTN